MVVKHFHHAISKHVEPVVEGQCKKWSRRLASRSVLADKIDEWDELEVLFQGGEVAVETVDSRSDVEISIIRH
jgi:hypothetical protein